ncbi:MAG: hypothetical protein ACYCST_19125 [Acidimicrobiales bacterium]
MALADELGLDGSSLSDATLSVLEGMLEPLEEALASGPMDSIGDVETLRHRRVADAAVRQASLEDVVAALGQLRAGRHEMRTCPAEVANDLRVLLASRLGERLRKALDRWRKKGVWPASRRYRPTG